MSAFTNDISLTATPPNHTDDARIRYAAATLLSERPHQFRWPHWLSYGSPNPQFTGIVILPSAFFGPSYGSSCTLPQLPLGTICDVPVLFGYPSVEKRGGQLIVGADLIASAYFLLTRYEEWLRPEIRDRHGNFPGKQSLPFRANFIHRPLVDDYARLLRAWALEIGISIPKPSRRFSVLLSHDVDSIGPPPGLLQAARSFAGGVFRRRPLSHAIQNTVAALGCGRHVADNLSHVAELDNSLMQAFTEDRCRSIFFFLGSNKTENAGNYSLTTSRVLRRIQEVIRMRAEIGLHASYEAGADPARIFLERRNLERATLQPVIKNRHHYLRWKEIADGWTIVSSGISWDSTLGYAHVAGFRLGVCRPITLFDPICCQLMPIEEHPLTVMDCTLSDSIAMHLSENQAFVHVRQLALATREHDGEFVILWHNTELTSIPPSYHHRLYPRVLRELAVLLSQS